MSPALKPEARNLLPLAADKNADDWTNANRSDIVYT
jgi:hypothetical protein